MKNLFVRVGRGDLSFKQTLNVLSAARASGASGGKIDTILRCGAEGRHPQNYERDVFAYGMQSFKLPRDILTTVKIKVRHAGQTVDADWSLLMPHEWFGLLNETNPDAFTASCGNDQANELYWQEAERNSQEWWLHHPDRDKVLGSFGMGLVTPVCLFGDDTGISKNCERPLRCLHWYAAPDQRSTWVRIQRSLSWLNRQPNFL